MKLIQSAMAPLFTLALMVLACSADATSTQSPRAIAPIEATQVAANGLPQLSPASEREIGRFKHRIAMNDSKPRSRNLGDTYCLKMLRACDAGNQSACDRFERYCAP